MASGREPVIGPELLLSLDRSSGGAGPLHEQLERALRADIRSGRLATGTRLPSTRALAATLGVSRGVVIEAYSQLVAEGYLTASQGAPTRVAAVESAERPPIAATALEARYEYDFNPLVPDLAAFPREQWTRSMRAAVRDAPFNALGLGDPRGAPELRNTLMEYLGRVRGAAAEPEHTIVCSGFTQAFAIVCRALAGRGVERIAVEDPGWAQHRLIAERSGLEVVAVPVDAAGLDVDALSESGCEVAVLTPAHQFPTGVVLSSERRGALLEWAEDTDALIIEDDYDSELRYDRGAVGALQGVSPERIAYIGSLSKRLAPGVGLGWVLSPSWLTGALTYEKGIADGGSPALEQLGLADFIAGGELDRHLRRMRLLYRGRREALLASLAGALPGARVLGVPAGLFVLVELPDQRDDAAVAAAAAGRGVGVDPLSEHRLAAGAPGLVLGYGNLSAEAIERGVGLLGEAARGSTGV